MVLGKLDSHMQNDATRLILHPTQNLTQSRIKNKVVNEAGQRLTELCQENGLLIANTAFQQHNRQLNTWTSQMVNTKIRLIIYIFSILYTFIVYTSIFHFSIWVSIYFKSGIEPVYPELADKFLSTGPTGSLAFLVLRDLWGIQSDSSWVAPQPVWRSLCGQLTRLIL